MISSDAIVAATKHRQQASSTTPTSSPEIEKRASTATDRASAQALAQKQSADVAAKKRRESTHSADSERLEAARSALMLGHQF